MSVIKNLPVMNIAKSSSTSKEEKAKSQFWINIGVPSGMTDENGTEYFISLPLGLALDNMEELPVRGQGTFRDFTKMRNQLLGMVKEAAMAMKPGEDCILNLQVQLRRANEEAEDTEENSFGDILTKFSLVK